MKTLLESYFGRYYHSTKVAFANSRVYTGKFSCRDEKACATCSIKTPIQAKNCSDGVLICDAGQEDVDVIEFEKFIDNYNRLKSIPSKSRCDLLMTSKNKIVFCDMTCSNPKYIDTFTRSDGSVHMGKRYEARKQIENSIKLLMPIPEIGCVIKNKSDKIALFAYREKPTELKDAFDREVTSGIRALCKENKDKDQMFSVMANGFLFTEVSYPDVYRW